MKEQYKKIEIGNMFERNKKIYKVIGYTDNKRVISSMPVEEPVCKHCGNRFIEHDVETSPNFQDNIEPIKSIEKL